MKKFSVWMEEQLHELAAPGQQPAMGTAPATTATTTAASPAADPKNPAYKALLGKNLDAAAKQNKVKGSLGDILNAVMAATAAGKTL
jgi:hypothetical protein